MKKHAAPLIAVGLIIGLIATGLLLLRRNGPGAGHSLEDSLGDPPAESLSIADPPANLEELALLQNASVAQQNIQNAGLCSLHIRAEGDLLIYSFRYQVAVSAKQLQSALDEMANLYGSQAAEFRAQGYEVRAVVIELLDWNGKELARKEYP